MNQLRTAFLNSVGSRETTAYAENRTDFYSLVMLFNHFILILVGEILGGAELILEGPLPSNASSLKVSTHPHHNTCIRISVECGR